MKEIIVITGASSGFGNIAARALAHAGHTVYASMRETTGRNARQVEELRKYAVQHNVDLRSIELDVGSQESADAAINHIIAENGRLDVVIHNAGHMVFGPTEAFTPEQLAQLYDVNASTRGSPRPSGAISAPSTRGTENRRQVGGDDHPLQPHIH
jgi:NADP-dependent 3-hydroxy acid dehydrogenase YdfG